jgi:hypothetical protein
VRPDEAAWLGGPITFLAGLSTVAGRSSPRPGPQTSAAADLREGMPITTWKFMARRADEPDYRYAGTQHRGRAPLVGEEIELVVENQMVKWTITEVLKDRSNRGIDVFTVRVNEQEQSGSRDASNVDAPK